MAIARSPHRCPRCHVPLHVGHAAAVVLHGCGRCCGVWLATACARRIAESLPAEAIALAARASHSARALADISAAASCPVCGQPMNRVSAAAARVDLDTCAAHGTWYDRHELEQIARVLGASTWHAARSGVAAGVGMAAGAGMAAPQVQASPGYGAADMAVVGVDVAAEVGVEVGFSMIGAILGAIFD